MKRLDDFHTGHFLGGGQYLLTQITANHCFQRSGNKVKHTAQYSYTEMVVLLNFLYFTDLWMSMEPA